MMHAPAAEHKWLLEIAGDWDVDCEMHCEPGKPAVTFKGNDSAEALGPFWIEARFTATMGGMPFVGRASTGYDTVRQKFVSTWVDVISPQLTLFEGTRDAQGVLRLRSTHDTPFGPGSRFETEEVRESADRRTFRMSVRLADNSVLPLMHYRYTRIK